MARLFTYGKLNRYATVPGANHLPGTYFNAYGIQYGASAFNNTANSIEPGEIVEIVTSTDKGYSVKRATASITLETSAIVLRDVMGVRTQQAGVFEEYVPGVPMTIVPCSAPQGWSIVVPVLATDTIAVGDTVYVGTGATTSVAGLASKTDVATECVELTGWRFASTKFTPTTESAQYCAVIEKI